MKAVALERVVRRDESPGRKRCREAKCAIRKRQQHTGSQSAQATLRNLEIRNEPSRTGLRTGCEACDHLRKHRLGETIEEEMSHDQIERGGRRLPVRQRRM